MGPEIVCGICVRIFSTRSWPLKPPAGLSAPFLRVGSGERPSILQVNSEAFYMRPASIALILMGTAMLMLIGPVLYLAIRKLG
jgi:hypothetical protein